MATPLTGTYYITDADTVKNDPALSDAVAGVELDTADINAAVIEAETFVEGSLIRLGYSRSQLSMAPTGPAPLVMLLITNWLRYVLMRDIYAKEAPQEGAGERYTKFKQNVEDTLERLEPDKDGKILLRILDLNGNILSPCICDPRFQIGSNTLNVTRAITMADSDEWRLDHTQSMGDAIGKKPGEH